MTPKVLGPRTSAATLQTDTYGWFASYIKNTELWKVIVGNAATFPEFSPGIYEYNGVPNFFFNFVTKIGVQYI